MITDIVFSAEPAYFLTANGTQRGSLCRSPHRNIRAATLQECLSSLGVLAIVGVTFAADPLPVTIKPDDSNLYYIGRFDAVHLLVPLRGG